jgi:hypothetical protein
MADMIMVVDAAVTVPVNLLPLIDDTDFKSVEDAQAYNAAGMDLRWNFVTVAGVQTSTPFTPTTSGVHDWTHVGDGLYKVELPASGGTVNNDTEGFGWISGRITGVLPFRGPVIQFSPAHIAHGLVTFEKALRVDPNFIEWAIDGGVLTVKEPDGTTTAYTKTADGDPDAEPVVGVS